MGLFGLGAWQCPTFAWGSTLSSARGGFTSEVGMGSGGARPPWPPGGSFAAAPCLPRAGPPAGACLAARAVVWDAHALSAQALSRPGRSSRAAVFCEAARPRAPSRAAWVLHGKASRAISTRQLQPLPAFHTAPINLVVFQGPSGDSRSQGGLISGGASRLDAFSGYPVRTWLPGNATGVTTGTPAVRPPRSSRTRGSFPQASNAHGR
jgi:hypothetical protein